MVVYWLYHLYFYFILLFVNNRDVYPPSPKVTDWVTCLLFSRSRVCFEKVTCLQLVTKFPIFYWTQHFITMFPIADNMFLSWTSLFVLTLSFHISLGIPRTLSLTFPNQNAVCTTLLFDTLHMPHQSHPSLRVHRNNICWVVQVMKPVLMQSLPVPSLPCSS